MKNGDIVTLGDLIPGDMFRINKKFYVKTVITEYDVTLCVRLSNGEQVRLYPFQAVQYYDNTIFVDGAEEASHECCCAGSGHSEWLEIRKGD